MQETKTWVLGVAAGLPMTLGLIAALDSYVRHVQTSAPREVIRLETVTVTAERPVPQPALASTPAKPASM
jgi:hypothetical protein